LLDLRGLRAPLVSEEKARLAAEAQRRLWRMKKIAVLARAHEAPESAAVRFFEDADEALQWLKGEA
jgi:hypothetical protein